MGIYQKSELLSKQAGSLNVRMSHDSLDKNTQSLYDDKTNTIDEICTTLNISRATLYRYIQVQKHN
jgi:predicted transcriptional regulator YheO